MLSRPKIISFICIFGYLSVLFTFPQVFSPGIKKLGTMVPAIYGILVAMHFIACVGLWYYKQWGVQLYLIAFFSKIIFYLLSNQTGAVFYVNALFGVVFMVVLLKHYRRMNPNL
ncbi:MAG: hypothetical protein WCR21_00875 [Bacteroidota bacterium]